METTKTINKEATIQNILNKCKEKKGVSINMENFNQRMSEPNEIQFLKEAADLVGVKVIYFD
jgi:hypothetical protein